MPFRDWKLRIQDILEAVAAVENYVAGMTFENFIQDQRTVDAVVRRFTIIGEASNHVPEEICNRNPHIPWADMRVIPGTAPNRKLPGIAMPLRPFTPTMQTCRLHPV